MPTVSTRYARTGDASIAYVGSGLRFADRGAHELRGVPDRWHLFTLER
jgi:hypothetical protein